MVAGGAGHEYGRDSTNTADTAQVGNGVLVVVTANEGAVAGFGPVFA